MQLEDAEEKRTEVIEHFDEEVPAETNIGRQIGYSKSVCSKQSAQSRLRVERGVAHDLIEIEERPAAGEPAREQGKSGRADDELDGRRDKEGDGYRSVSVLGEEHCYGREQKERV